LFVTDAFNCRSLQADQVKVTVVPSVRIFAGNDTIAAMNQPIQLKARELSTAGVTTYTWTPATFLSTGTSATPIATLTADQRFLVVGRTPDGCQGIDDILIKVYKGPDIYMPSAFSPNNDGLNDILLPVPVGIKELQYLRIFNRWGSLIFSSNDPKKGWDGRVKGTEQGTGTYVWVSEGIDYKGNHVIRKGVVTVIR
jgi:gliding motility-associated-like protein